MPHVCAVVGLRPVIRSIATSRPGRQRISASAPNAASEQPMDPIVLSPVLAAAVLHASWNALVKAGGDPFVRLGVVNAVGRSVHSAAAVPGGPPARRAGHI